MMQVILKEDVPHLGKSGDLVEVRPGYGRNYLIPQGLAATATAGNIAQIEHQKRLIAAKNAKLLKESEEIAQKLTAIEVTISRQAGEEQKLFGSVTGRDIADALADKGVSIDHKKIVMGEPIKTIGSHSVDVKLGQGVTGKIKVLVTAK
jgi:large subunit ribosomal protein L9